MTTRGSLIGVPFAHGRTVEPIRLADIVNLVSLWVNRMGHRLKS
jgi:hypothetical protein